MVRYSAEFCKEKKKAASGLLSELGAWHLAVNLIDG